MLKKIVLAAMIAGSTFIAVPQAATAGPGDGPADCYLNCHYVWSYDASGNPVGGHWECPGEQAECVGM